MEHKRLIACIGNIFLGDDAFGVVVARKLAAAELPADVRLIDFGIRGYDLACALMEPWEQVVLVDALPQGGEPGTVYVMEPDAGSEEGTAEPSFDPHALHPVAVLQMVRRLGGEIPPLLVIGCEPACFAPDESDEDGLSPPVRAAVDEVLRILQERMRPGGKPAANVLPQQGDGICPPEKLSA